MKSLSTEACSCVLVFLQLKLNNVVQVEESKGKRPLQDNATKKMILIAVNKAGCTKHTNVRHKGIVSHKGYLTLNSFEKNGDGGGPSNCDNQYHSDDTPIVAISTGWFNHKNRCHKKITINGNGRSMEAMVIDQCDSTKGCDADHAYQPPCANNIVDASKAVWEALGVPHDQWGGLEITWSDA